MKFITVIAMGVTLMSGRALAQDCPTDFVAVSPTGEPSDKDAVRAALACVADGGTVFLEGGVFDFSGTNGLVKIDKPVRIVGDPEDPPLLRGREVTRSISTWSGSMGSGANHGFVVTDLAHDVAGVEISGVHFDAFARAIYLAPWFSGTTTGTLSDVRVEDCHFTRAGRAIQIATGGVSGFRFVGNTMADFAFAPQTSAGISLINGDMSDGLIEGNTIVSDMPSVETLLIGIWAPWGESVVIRGNRVEMLHPLSSGIEVGKEDGWMRGQVLANDIAGLGAGIVAYGGASEAVIRHNRVDVDGVAGDPVSGIGLAFIVGAADHVATHNTFLGEGGPMDVLFDFDSTHNMLVATDFTTHVVDLGTRNRIVGTQAAFFTPNLSDARRAHREAVRAKILEP